VRVEEEPVMQEIRPRELQGMIEAGEPIYLLDVRQPAEHEFVALPDSVLIPLTELPNRVEEVKPASDALIVVYCHHGVRSLHGGRILERFGHTKVASLAGGIDAWSLEVDPVLPRYL
jgi:adenylyltransferase/sulfurtransferase